MSWEFVFQVSVLYSICVGATVAGYAAIIDMMKDDSKKD